MSEFFMLLQQQPFYLYGFIAVLSLCIGSFLNVVIYRLPKMLELEWKKECQILFNQNEQMNAEPNLSDLSLSWPRSHCPQCQQQIAWYHNIPLLSWLWLKGKCSHCKQSINIQYPIVELLSLVISLFLVWHFGFGLQLLAALIFSWILLALIFIDFQTLLLPDRLTISLAGLGLLFSTYQLWSTPTASIWGLIIGFMSLWSVYYLFKLFTGKEGMGYGDFKLLAAIGAWLGVTMLLPVIFLSAIIGIIYGLCLRWLTNKDEAFAFGPCLAIASWLHLIYFEPIQRYFWMWIG